MSDGKRFLMTGYYWIQNRYYRYDHVVGSDAAIYTFFNPRFGQITLHFDSSLAVYIGPHCVASGWIENSLLNLTMTCELDTFFPTEPIQKEVRTLS